MAKRTMMCEHCTGLFTYTYDPTRVRRFCSLACSRDSERKPLSAYDLTTRIGRAQARRAGYEVPKLAPGIKPTPLWEMVDKSGECWVYTGPLNRDGYGAVTRNYRTRMVHKIIWEEHNGPVPTGMHLCHRCDNPACVRPEHLFIGTPAENIADKVRKGRQAKGERNAQSKLTLEQARQIKASSETHAQLGIRFGVSEAAIQKIKSGKNWRHA